MPSKMPLNTKPPGIGRAHVLGQHFTLNASRTRGRACGHRANDITRGPLTRFFLPGRLPAYAGWMGGSNQQAGSPGLPQLYLTPGVSGHSLSASALVLTLSLQLMMRHSLKRRTVQCCIAIMRAPSSVGLAQFLPMPALLL